MLKKDEIIYHNTVTIKNQEINNDVKFANSPVVGNNIISNIKNISEQSFFIYNLTTTNLQWEPYEIKEIKYALNRFN